MRYGTILSYNKVAGIGLIRDSNQQHILFHRTNTSVIPMKGSTVTFKIEYLNGSLAAVDIKYSTSRVLSDKNMLSK